MLKHIVLYKLNEEGLKNLDKIKNNFLSMRGKIDGLLSVECGADVLKSERSFDFALVCEFETLKVSRRTKRTPCIFP